MTDAMGKGTLPSRLRLRVRALVVAVAGALGTHGRRMVLVLMTGLGLLITSVAAASAIDRGKDIRAALAVGMALTVIGVFGDRISEVTAKWGDKELAVKQVIDEAGRRIDRLTADEATPEPVREELRQISTDVEVARRLTDAAPRRRGQRPAAWHPEHLVAPTGDVLLKLSGPSSLALAHPRRFRCTVTSTDGASVSAIREPSMIGMASVSMYGGTRVELRWPDEFAGAVPVEGRFYVTWSTASTATVGLLPDAWADVAYDVFTSG